MRDRIVKQAYDRGYDDALADKAAVQPRRVNPYKPPSRNRRSYYVGAGRHELWGLGYQDARDGRPRKISQDEAGAIAREVTLVVARATVVLDSQGALLLVDGDPAALVAKARALFPTAAPQPSPAQEVRP